MLEKALLDAGYTQDEINKEKNKAAFIARESDKTQAGQTPESAGTNAVGGAASAPAEIDIDTSRQPEGSSGRPGSPWSRGPLTPEGESNLPEPAAEAPEVAKSVRDEYISFVQKYIEQNISSGGNYEDLYQKLAESEVSRPIVNEGNISKYLKDNNEKYGYPVLYMELYAQKYNRNEIVDTIVQDYLKANAQEHTLMALGSELVSMGFSTDEVNRNIGETKFRELQEGEVESPVSGATPAPAEQTETVEQVLSGTTNSTSRVSLGDRFRNFFQNLRSRRQPEGSAEDTTPESASVSEPIVTATDETTTVESEPQIEREPLNLNSEEIFGQIPELDKTPEFVHPADRLPNGSAPTPEGTLQDNITHLESDFRVGDKTLQEQTVEEIESTTIPAYQNELIRLNNEIARGNTPDRDFEEVRTDLGKIQEYIELRKNYERPLP